QLDRVPDLHRGDRRPRDPGRPAGGHRSLLPRARGTLRPRGLVHDPPRRAGGRRDARLPAWTLGPGGLLLGPPLLPGPAARAPVDVSGCRACSSARPVDRVDPRPSVAGDIARGGAWVAAAGGGCPPRGGNRG